MSSTPEIQAKRLMDRDNFSETDAFQRIKAQMSLTKKCENSHFVVENSASFDETRTQVEKIICALQASNHHVTVKIYLFVFFVMLCFVLTGFIYLVLRVFHFS
jgi:ribose 1,5-bisphosphokinase PhnN